MSKTTLKRITTFVAASISTALLLSEAMAGATGLTQNQLNVLYEGIPFFNTELSSCTGQASTTSSSTLVGADNIEKAYNFFLTKSLTPVQAAGIVGNFWWESHGVDPAIEQAPGSWGDTKTTPSPPYPDYEHAVGIAQWDGGRRIAIINDASSSNKDVKDLAFQLDYSWTELNESYPKVLQDLKATTSASDATMVFGRGYESPAEATAAWDKRIGEANVIVAKYGGGTSSAGSSSCGVTCDPNGDITVGNLSQTRQQVVCIARGELSTVWTPLPPSPRMQYTKYTDGWMCNGGQAPTGNSCGSDGNEFWCADFASWVYKQAGDAFTGGVSGGWRLPAVDQIMSLGKVGQQFHWHDSSSYTPVPGDLAIHKGPNGYSHVNIVVNVTGGNIQLIGGDQGSGPYGGPDSASVVSQVSINSPTGDSTIGYVSPD